LSICSTLVPIRRASVNSDTPAAIEKAAGRERVQRLEDARPQGDATERPGLLAVRGRRGPSLRERRRGVRRPVVDAYVNNLRVEAEKKRQGDGEAWSRYQDALSRLVSRGKVTQRRANEVLQNAQDASREELLDAVEEMRAKFGR
jgi:hypothetical protein